MHTAAATRISENRLSDVIGVARVSGTSEREKGLPSTAKAGEATPGTNIYDIHYDGEIPNLYSLKYAGFILNYFAVGVIYGGSTNILYPVLQVKNQVESNFYNAASTMVLIFWSYKIFFGIVSDCFPILGLKRKSYMIIGWVLCFAMLVGLAFQGNDIKPLTLVIFLILANFAYVLADVASDGYLVFLAHKEPIEQRGRAQSIAYISRQFGRILVALLIGLFFSGPNVSCPGYKWDDQACDIDNDPFVSSSPFFNETSSQLEFPEGGEWNDQNYCHFVCDSAVFKFGLEIPQYAWIIVAVNALVVPFLFFLNEEKSVRDKFTEKMSAFWHILQNRAVWQVVLWVMVSNIFGSLDVNAKGNTINLWLKLSPLMSALLSIFEDTIFAVGLILIKTYLLNTSWRVMLICSFFLYEVFSAMYFLIVYDVIRNVWLYVFMDVSQNFITTANFLAGVYCIVEVSQPGYEAMTYALITTASNMMSPVVSVVNNQISSFFDLSNSFLKNDDDYVHQQYLYNWILTQTISVVVYIPLLFLLPRQKKEARELLAKGEMSKKWAGFVVISGIVLLLYSTAVNFLTLLPDVGCHKIFGGSGCEDPNDPDYVESGTGAFILVALAFAFGIIPPFIVWYKHYRPSLVFW